MFSPQLGSLLALVLFAHASQARAQEYERARPDGHRLLCRSSRTFTYALSLSTGHPTPEERAAIEAAVHGWRQAAASCSDLVFERTADVPAGQPTPQDGRTLITFRPVRCADVVPSGDACHTDYSCGEKFGCWSHDSLAVVNPGAGILFRMATGEIIGAHIELNASSGLLTTVDGPPCPPGAPAPDCVAGDVQSLVTRSIGESLGFALVARADSTMSRRLDWGDIQKRTIDPGTLQGLCELYPRGQPTPECTHLGAPDAGAPGSGDGGDPPGESAPPSGCGCGTTRTAPLLGALVLLLGIRGARRYEGRAGAHGVSNR
jgi:hypothetical protein